MINEELDGTIDGHLDPGMKEISSYLKKLGVTTLFSCIGHWKQENKKTWWSSPYLVFDVNEDFAKYINKKYRTTKTKLYTRDNKHSKIVMSVHPNIRKNDTLKSKEFWDYITDYKKENVLDEGIGDYIRDAFKKLFSGRLKKLLSRERIIPAEIVAYTKSNTKISKEKYIKATENLNKIFTKTYGSSLKKEVWINYLSSCVNSNTLPNLRSLEDWIDTTYTLKEETRFKYFNY